MLHRATLNPARLAALGVLLTQLLLGTLYGIVTPAFEAPDEIGHFYYVNFIRTHARRPVFGDEPGAENWQPPLYYILAAAVSSPAELTERSGMYRRNNEFSFDNPAGPKNFILHGTLETFPYTERPLALHLARELSVVLGVLAAAATMLLGRELFPQHPAVPLLAGALVAFNPQFLFVSGAVSNDTLIALLATLGWWWLVRTARRSADPQGAWRAWLAMGAWGGAALLAKSNGALVGLCSGLVLLACAARLRSWRLLWQGSVALLAGALLTAGLYFADNLAMYGDPLGLAANQQELALMARPQPLQPADLWTFTQVQFRSFWGLFGWTNVPAPDWLYAATLAMSLAGLAGLGLFAWRGGFARLALWQRAGLAIVALAAVAQEIFILLVITRCDASCYQGRLLFPAIGPWMLLVSLGLVSLVPPRAAPWVAAGLAGALALAAVYMPIRVIAPAYPMVPLPKWALWAVPDRTTYAFGSAFALPGYRVERQARQVRLTLYWQAQARPDCDCIATVRLTGPAGAPAAFSEHVPGQEAGFAPTAWWPEDLVTDTHILELPSGTLPGVYTLQVSLREPSTGTALPVTAAGQPMPGAATLPTGVHFDGATR